MTLFVLLFMIITTYANIFSIPSYGWIRIYLRLLIFVKRTVRIQDNSKKDPNRDEEYYSFR
jgi:hypothetical protein